MDLTKIIERNKSEKQRKAVSQSRLLKKKKLGYINSPQTREKMSIAHRDKKLSKKTKLKMSQSHKGRKPYQMTDDIKRKISKSRIGLQVGEKHPNWKGGITPQNKALRNSINFKIWRKSVFERDNFTCQKCKISGSYLHPHHISNFSDFPELRFAIDNGVTFCRECHINFHKKYGRKNNTKEQLERFLI